VRAGALNLRVEARAITSPLNVRATTMMYLVGVRLTP
jgi:hypothetical protein